MRSLPRARLLCCVLRSNALCSGHTLLEHILEFYTSPLTVTSYQTPAWVLADVVDALVFRQARIQPRKRVLMFNRDFVVYSFCSRCAVLELLNTCLLSRDMDFYSARAAARIQRESERKQSAAGAASVCSVLLLGEFTTLQDSRETREKRMQQEQDAADEATFSGLGLYPTNDTIREWCEKNGYKLVRVRLPVTYDCMFISVSLSALCDERYFLRVDCQG